MNIYCIYYWISLQTLQPLAESTFDFGFRPLDSNRVKGFHRHHLIIQIYVTCSIKINWLLYYVRVEYLPKVYFITLNCTEFLMLNFILNFFRYQKRFFKKSTLHLTFFESTVQTYFSLLFYNFLSIIWNWRICL